MDRLPRAITTSRLKLRSPVLEDAAAVFEQYAQDEEVTKYMTWRSHSDIKTTQKYLKECLNDIAAETAWYWTILPKQENEAIGMIRLQCQNHRAELGYVLARSYWNRGLMSEALPPLIDRAIAQPSIYRVWAVCDLENLASARVLEKVGMVREGILHRWLIHPNLSNEPRDCFCYAKVK